MRRIREEMMALSRFIGVSYHPYTGKWQARVRKKDGKYSHVGTYGDEEEAARAYDKRAYRMYGEEAKLNFPDCIKCPHNPN